MEFVADLRKNFGETGQSLAKSLDTDLATIEQLLEQLDTLFIAWRWKYNMLPIYI